MQKILWLFGRLIDLIIVCIRLFFYCAFHPRKFFELFFAFYSTINEFDQVTYGKLNNFYETETYKKVFDKKILAGVNVFNSDPRVTRPMEAQVISSLVVYLQPRTIFEFGTYNGFTTLHFAVNSPSDCTVYTLDLPPDYDVQTRQAGNYSYDDLQVVRLSREYRNNRIYQDHPQRKKIKELFADSQTFDFSPYYGKMDFIYIDGNHSYLYVKSDTEAAFRMLSPRGIILWHDFDYIAHRNVFNYLRQLSKTYKVYSIPKTRFAVYGKELS